MGGPVVGRLDVAGRDGGRAALGQRLHSHHRLRPPSAVAGGGFFFFGHGVGRWLAGWLPPTAVLARPALSYFLSGGFIYMGMWDSGSALPLAAAAAWLLASLCPPLCKSEKQNVQIFFNLCVAVGLVSSLRVKCLDDQCKQYSSRWGKLSPGERVNLFRQQPATT